MVRKGLVSPQDGRFCIHVRLLLKEIYPALPSRLRAPVLPVRAACREEGMVPGQRGLARDTGLRVVVGTVNSVDAPCVGAETSRWALGGSPPALG